MRTALITGGSRGIGAACVRAFATDGYRVAFLYRSAREQAEALARETGAVALQADVADSTQVNAACEQALTCLGHIDALVNNAGVSLVKLLQDVTDNEWAHVLGANLTGTFYVTRAIIPGMISRQGGRIVNISSIWGMVGGSLEAAYSASKAGVLGLTKALAKELGPSGVTVNAIAPGATRTDMMACYDEATLRDIADETPLGRLAEPEEIARAALWLCSDNASMVTGQILSISGGRVIV